MMEMLASYIRSVCTASMIVGILGCLFKEDGKGIVMFRLLCGVFMLVIVIHPVTGFRFEALEEFSAQTFYDAEAAAGFGQERSREEIRSRIKAETQAYILDKADGVGASVNVDVILNQDDIPIPEEVILSGEWSDYARAYMTQIIASDLGIPEDRQIWTGSAVKNG